MVRRISRNETGIDRISPPKGSTHDAWVAYICVNCNQLNHLHIGERLLTPEEAYETQNWVCDNCGFAHNKQASLPATWDTNWLPELLHAGELTVNRFWKAFFKNATENPQAYWKFCNTCGRIQPSSYFSKHSNWGPLEKQMECRACKAAINAVLNPQRTSEQLRESSVRRRIGDLLVSEYEEKLDVRALFDRFENKCFKTGKPLDITKTGSWHIDHILPSKYLYALNSRNAALLSEEANSNKRDRWPSEFYSPQELVELARITGADLALLSKPEPVQNANITSNNVNRAVDRYLDVRNSTDLSKRIEEIKKVLESYNLSNLLDNQHKKMLGLI